ncbi:MAG: amino acid ABC transporter substrate-binding protein [Desulfobacteraceae bacterium]|nr:amino acid ABC transporter substrate-binding protein [Desulfobacteraceae bacterium]
MMRSTRYPDEPHLSITPWARAVQYVKTGKMDILFPTGKNLDRQKIFNYSDESINKANFLIYVKADNKIKWNGVKSLNGLTIGVVRGYNCGDQWKYADGVIQYGLNTISQGFIMLSNERIDGFFGYEYIWDYFLKQKNWKNRYRKLPVFDSSAEYLVTLKSNPKGKKILKDFDNGKKRLIRSGKLKKIKNRWFGN